MADSEKTSLRISPKRSRGELIEHLLDGVIGFVVSGFDLTGGLRQCARQLTNLGIVI
jgi:hypothetical protein